MGRFRLYSLLDTNGDAIAPTTTPDDLVTPPATLIAWDRDPVKAGSFEVQDPDGRGKVIETGDLGIVIQDIGVPTAGGIITIETGVTRGEHLEVATAGAFKAAWELEDSEYYLTDGYRVWRVVWQRKPRGCNLYLNQQWIRRGRLEYSYKFIFVIKATEVDLI
jgi:hypothetical protein